MTNLETDRKILKRAYWGSLLGGIIISNVISIILTNIFGFFMKIDGSFISRELFYVLGSFCIIGIFYIIPALLNLMFFMIRKTKKYFLWLPLLITATIYGSLMLILFDRPNDAISTQCYIFLTSIIFSEIVTVFWVNRLVKRNIIE
jgi:hypothetical protein